MKRALEVDSGDGCTSWMHLTPRLVRLRMLKMVNSMLHIFYHSKRKMKLFFKHMSRPYPGKGARQSFRENGQRVMQAEQTEMQRPRNEKRAHWRGNCEQLGVAGARRTWLWQGGNEKVEACKASRGHDARKLRNPTRNSEIWTFPAGGAAPLTVTHIHTPPEGTWRFPSSLSTVINYIIK